MKVLATGRRAAQSSAPAQSCRGWLDTTPGTPLMTLRTAGLLHPAAAKDIDIQSPARDFHQTFCDQALADPQISAILADQPGGAQ